MVEIVEIETEERELAWLPLSEKVFEAMDLSIGGWVLLKSTKKGVVIEKIELEQEIIETDTELLEKALIIRDLEGYYTLEETLSNMVRKGLAGLYEERGESEKAEKYKNSWVLQVHSPKEKTEQEVERSE